MTGKCYYITTLAHWQHHAARFANSHWVALDPRAPGPPSANEDGSVGAQHARRAESWRAAPGAALPESINVQDVSLEGAVATSAADIEPSPTETDAGSPHQNQASAPGPPEADHAPTGKNTAPSHADAKILVLIEADEGVHLSLEGEPAFEALPHPLAQKPISDAAQSALAPHGVAPGATTFDAMETLARVHPLLRHRVF